MFLLALIHTPIQHGFDDKNPLLHWSSSRHFTENGEKQHRQTCLFTAHILHLHALIVSSLTFHNEPRPTSNHFSAFRKPYRDYCQPEVVSDIISGTAVE